MLTWLNAAAVLAVFLLLCIVSERWWVSAVLTYLPRLPYLVPAALLLIASLFVRRSVAWVNLLAIVVIAGPVMGLTMPRTSAADASSAAKTIRVLTCNTQDGRSSLPRLDVEIERAHADVLVFQEATDGVGEMEKLFADWHQADAGEFWILARWPVRLVSECRTQSFGRRTAILCEVDTPEGVVLVASIHLNTPRKGVDELRWHSVLSGSGVEEFNEFQKKRAYEMLETRRWLDEQAGGKPLIVAGDFNTPTTSSLFVGPWAGLQSAFEAAGLGYGYTVPCSTDRVWPHNTPWARIDHILCSADWLIDRCEIGHTDGSDHRLLWADLQRTSVPSSSLATSH